MTHDGDRTARAAGMPDVSAPQQALIAVLKAQGHLCDPRIEAAFRAVPRHPFLPTVPLDRVYSDEAIPTKERDGLVISSSSQPAVMAIMLHQLALQPGERVLEIGAGTGYNAALLAHLVGETGTVVTMDIDEDIVTTAREHLIAAGYTAVRVVCGDGALGYAPAAPYDRIILSVGVWDLAPAWVTQLRPGGRLLLPLAVHGPIQKLVAFERHDDHLVSVSVREGGFMPLRGVAAGPQLEVALGPETGLVLGLGQPQAVDAEGVYQALRGPHSDTLAPTCATTGALWAEFALWLAAREPAMCLLAAVGEGAGHDRVPPLFSSGRLYRSTLGLLADTTLCVLARPDGAEASADAIAVRRFGPREDLAHHLISHLAAFRWPGSSSTGPGRARPTQGSQRGGPTRTPAHRPR